MDPNDLNQDPFQNNNDIIDDDDDVNENENLNDNNEDNGDIIDNHVNDLVDDPNLNPDANDIDQDLDEDEIIGIGADNIEELGSLGGEYLTGGGGNNDFFNNTQNQNNLNMTQNQMNQNNMDIDNQGSVVPSGSPPGGSGSAVSRGADNAGEVDSVLNPEGSNPRSLNRRGGSRSPRRNIDGSSQNNNRLLNSQSQNNRGPESQSQNDRNLNSNNNNFNEMGSLLNSDPLGLNNSMQQQGSRGPNAPQRGSIRSSREFTGTQMSGNSDNSSFLDNYDEHDYDINHEKIERDTTISDRLRVKIMNNFTFFIRNFKYNSLNGNYGEAIADTNGTVLRYKLKLEELVKHKSRVFIVSFPHLFAQRECANLAWWISQFPNKILPILNESAREEAKKVGASFERGDGPQEDIHVAIDDFPLSDPLRKLRIDHLNQFITVEAVVTRRTQVFNKYKNVFYKCEKCEEINGPYCPRNDDELFEMKKILICANVECQSKYPFSTCPKLTTYENYQRITIQEPPGSVLAGRMPRSKEAILIGELVDSVKPGDLVTLTGVYTAEYDVEQLVSTNYPVFKTEIQVNYITKQHDEKKENYTLEDIKIFEDLSKQPDIRERIIQSIAPSIYGESHIKTAIALAMFGGCPQQVGSGHRVRGDLNILILGDPGMAKSQFLKYVSKTFPRAIYTTGKGASGVGLTASVGRDPMTGEYVLEGGAMVLADQGLCLIDEFDKMNDQDRTSIHEAMEQQTISITKAGICATLSARCAVIAAANPLNGRYDSQLSFNQNVDLTDPILSRFDILCVLKDIPDSGKDDMLADFVICSHMRSHPNAGEDLKRSLIPKGQAYASTVNQIGQETLMLYIQYARRTCQPKMEKADREKIAKFYQEIRRESGNLGGNKMTVRHVESMVRIAEANARMELRSKVEKRDVDQAIAIMLESFCQTQKHSSAQELRKKFQHYIAGVQNHQRELHGLLSRFLTREEMYKRSTMANSNNDHEIPEVLIKKDRFVTEARKYLLQESVNDYLNSDVFKSAFVYVPDKRSSESTGFIRRKTEEDE